VDGDGGLDLLVVNRDGPAYLLLNQVAERGNWVRFRARLGDPERDAHGATVSALVGGVRVHADIRPEGSYLASSEAIAHFGLGSQTRVEDVEVRWPGSPHGESETFGSFDAGQTVVLRRSASALGRLAQEEGR
jgi:hypothetical protein